MMDTKMIKRLEYVVQSDQTVHLSKLLIMLYKQMLLLTSHQQLRSYGD